MAESISSGRIVKKPEIVVDPNFYVPPGITDVRTQTNEERGAIQPGSRGVEGGDGIDIEYTFDNPDLDPAGMLRPPAWMKVISQVVRQGPAGQQVVDVILEVEDVPGADDYQVRVSKR